MAMVGPCLCSFNGSRGVGDLSCGNSCASMGIFWRFAWARRRFWRGECDPLVVFFFGCEDRDGGGDLIFSPDPAMAGPALDKVAVAMCGRWKACQRLGSSRDGSAEDLWFARVIAGMFSSISFGHLQPVHLFSFLMLFIDKTVFRVTHDTSSRQIDL